MPPAMNLYVKISHHQELLVNKALKVMRGLERDLTQHPVVALAVSQLAVLNKEYGTKAVFLPNVRQPIGTLRLAA